MDVLSAAALLLDMLESGGELPIPNVMRRIRDLLAERLLEVETARLGQTMTETVRPEDEEDQNWAPPALAYSHHQPQGEPVLAQQSEPTATATISTAAASSALPPPAPMQARKKLTIPGTSPTDMERRRFFQAVEVLARVDGPLYVDIQCLENAHDEMVIKEFAAGSLNTPLIADVMVKPPDNSDPSPKTYTYVRASVNGLR